MKALSIKDPWAWLICSNIKDIENRTWKTNYRGRIYVHVSANPDKKWIDIYPVQAIDQLPKFRNKGCYSAIIGEVTITDCIKNSNSIWANNNCWHWLLKDAVLYDRPILNVKGRLGLWEYNK